MSQPWWTCDFALFVSPKGRKLLLAKPVKRGASVQTLPARLTITQFGGDIVGLGQRESAMRLKPSVVLETQDNHRVFFWRPLGGLQRSLSIHIPIGSFHFSTLISKFKTRTRSNFRHRIRGEMSAWDALTSIPDEFKRGYWKLIAASVRHSYYNSIYLRVYGALSLGDDATSWYQRYPTVTTI